MCFCYDTNHKAFVTTFTDDGEDTFYIQEDEAFSIARNTNGYATVYLGNKRYRFLDGIPILCFVDKENEGCLLEEADR